MIVYSIFWLATICAGLLARRRQAVLAVYLFVFLFVGLRLETGFDWPVYKSIFDSFADGFSFEKVALAQLQYSQEIAFVFLVGLLAQVTPTYEFTQAIFTFFFLYAFFKLASEIPGSRPALALAIFLSFFLLSVGFSTVRQTLAISLFNMGLYHFLRGRRLPFVFGFFFAATAIHLSSAAYVLIFVAALVYKRFVGRIRIFSHIVLSGALLVVLPLIFFSAGVLFPQIVERTAYFEGLTLNRGIDAISLLFAALMFLTGLVVAARRRGDQDSLDRLVLFKNMTSIFSAVAFASIFFLTLRDRIAYELIVLFSISASSFLSFRNLVLACSVIMFGLIYQHAILRPPRHLAFVPYQNSLVFLFSGMESTGVQRSSQYLEIFVENLSR